MRNFIKISLCLYLLFGLISFIYSQNPAGETTVNLTRVFSKDLFETNGAPYLQPLASAMNSTSNARFFNRAYVPKKVKVPYIKFSVNGMLGFVREDQKTYKPQIPNEELDYNRLSEYIDYNPFTLKASIKGDTAKFYYYILKVYAWKMLSEGLMKIPESAPTVLGSSKKQGFKFPMTSDGKSSVLDSLVKAWPTLGPVTIYSLLDENVQKELSKTISEFPQEMTLTEGGDFSTLRAGIPQIEIGSLFGTEALIRFIPPVNMGEKIGYFAFWGIGLKHSISQYFPERWFDAAVQAVYQGTSLENEIGVTKAKLNAGAEIWDFNLQLSKNLFKFFDVYTGISYEYINIKSDYTYYIPIETQMKLNITDDKPQKSKIELSDDNIKWVVGLTGRLGPFSLFADYSISKFNIFSGGFEININDLLHFFRTGKFFETGKYDISDEDISNPIKSHH